MWRPTPLYRTCCILQNRIRNANILKATVTSHLPQVNKFPVSASCCNMTTQATTQPVGKMVVQPASCLHDEAVSVRVEGLHPGDEVTLHASMTDTRGVCFLSFAHYRADADGQVDVSTLESLGGSYKGVFPMGLISSMSPALHKQKFTRFFKRDVENPNIVTLSVYRGHLTSDDVTPGNTRQPLSTATHLRHYMAPGVQRIPVRYGKVRGCLFLPPGDGPFPGVVDMFGSAGGLLEYRSAQLASRGIASLALAFFAYEDLPKDLQEFDISYFEEAVEFLLQHDKVMSKGVGVIGTSKGGDLALAMATFIPSVSACVTINGYLAPIHVGIRVGHHFYRGVPLDIMEQCRVNDDGTVQAFISSIKKQYLESVIPIEQSNAAFLFLVGNDDKHIAAEYVAQECCRRLSQHGYSKPFEISSHPGTGHLLEPPYSLHCYASLQHSAMLAVVWGGTARHHTLGQVNAWFKMLDFLKLHITQTNNLNVNNESCKAKLKSRL